MFIGKPECLKIDSRCRSNATFEAAYGLEGWMGASSLTGRFTEPYISEVPI
jgi:hypothetical protein